jgi:hypothetical protein
MTTIDHLRKRVEYLLGMSIQDELSVADAVKVQDEMRKKSLSLAPGEDSTTMIRRWRDTRWS